MSFFRRHPVGSGTLVGLAIACAGSYLGQVLAMRMITEIAEKASARRPDDPLDGLWIIGLGTTLTGGIIGTVVGIAMGVMTYLWLRSRQPGRSEMG
jgi:F0F1-type ATP synthase membrane subunit c/vacuolar-type H+-ATPase subunit K